ncbi:MAG: HAD-IA family hydrolase [Rhodobiaceae bacterium]|jgi:putative hydrolase of the HAD superfamily|nr:HAD-IA family hydrolase [Rhodobiaceae bacterium]MBT7280232.1 HAD-IA family hydrolase [Rhodobiaceae bacterium]MDG2495206.1 HAD-IA family hydrolase [Alphaproteobacteria bacterium]
MSENYKAVLWDFGGVITSSPFEAFAAYEKQNGLPENFIRGINATNPDSNAWAKFERSDIDAASFDTAFLAEAEARGHSVRGGDVLALLAGAIRPEMVAVLERLKAEGYRIACITNNVKTGAGAGMARTQEKADAVAKVMQLFEHVIESSEVGVRKPDPAIYQMACDKLGVAPSDCVFLDDLGINLKPARAMGMGTVKVVSAAQGIADLSALLGQDIS